MMFMSMCMGAAIGTGIVVSQYFGAKDEKGTAALIANGSYACILIAVLMTLLALVTTKPMIYVSSIILQRIVNGFGESVIGAFTATTQIELLVQQSLLIQVRT